MLLSGRNGNLMKKHPILSVDLIIQDNQGKILLGKISEKWREGNKYLWGLPGREVSYGETLVQCVKRNLREEIGMKMLSCKVVCINSNFGYGNHYITIGILTKAKGSPINKQLDDWIEWKWFKRKDIPSKLFPSAKMTLKAFLKESNLLTSSKIKK